MLISSLGIIMFSEEHRMLVEYAKKRLVEEGYRLIAEDASVGGGRADLLASKEGRLAAVECIRQVQPKNLAKRVRGLKDMSVIYCVPDELEAERLRKAGFKGEVWVAGLEIGYTTLKIPKATAAKLLRLAKPGESLPQVIERLASEKLEENREKE